MNNKIPKSVAGIVIAGSVFGGAAISTPNSVIQAVEKPSELSITSNKESIQTLRLIVEKAYNGEMPFTAKGLKINKSTHEDVQKKFGIPPEPSGNGYDFYHPEMGHPGFAFAYNKNHTLREIRYFGTNVGRETNLGGITPQTLSNRIGSADLIRGVKGTNEINYIYKIGEYELQFIVGEDNTVNHVNLKYG